MEKKFIEEIRTIYGLLQDDISKEIWGGRMLYSLTGDMRYIRKVVCTTEAGGKAYDRMRFDSRKKVIFGSGIIGKRLVDIFGDIKFECFVDNKHAGEICKGLAVIGVEELKEKYSDALIIISSRVYHSEILKQLLEEGFKEESIINIGEECDKLCNVLYFDLEELKSDIKDAEVFVDGGCYDGKDALAFFKWCENLDVKEPLVYAWEPDPKNIEGCKARLDAVNGSYEIIEKGLWSKVDRLYFEMAGVESSISENGTLKVDVDSIDNMIKTPVTFIKMDIEGSEYQALLGAKETIKKCKPKLAISIYHKPEDIWEIPRVIHQINPGYKFYIRHYSLATQDTVLYAIDESMDNN